MSNFTDFFGGGGVGALGVYPVVQPLGLGDAAYRDYVSAKVAEGFNGDGDYIEFPQAAGSSMVYYNNAHVQQWSYNRNTIHGLGGTPVDFWVGFYLDDSDGLLYVVGVDTATTPNTFYLSSVDSAGNRVNIGSVQPANDFNSSPNWNLDANTGGSSLIARDSDGSGNIFVRVSTSSPALSMEEMELNISTGAVVSDPAGVMTSDPEGTGSNADVVAYKSADGIYLSLIAAGSGVESALFCIYDGDNVYPPIKLPIQSGMPINGGGFKIMLWKGKVGLFSQNSNEITGPRYWSKLSMDGFMRNLRSLYR